MTELRQFVTLFVLAGGQVYAPLLPPLSDGRQFVRGELGPDGRTVLGRGDDGVAHLWDTRTGRRIVALGERARAAGYSPDGSTAFTDGDDGVVRVWDTADGSLRCRTAARPGRRRAYQLEPPPDTLWFDPTVVVLDGDRILTREARMLMPRPTGEGKSAWEFCGPVELWDAGTGRLVAALDADGRDVGSFRFLANGRFVSAVEGRTAVALFDAVDGRPHTRVSLPAGEELDSHDLSADGRRLLTLSHRTGGGSEYRVWDADDGWRPTPVRSDPRTMTGARWATDELFTGWPDGDTNLYLFRPHVREPVAREDGFGSYRWRYHLVGERMLTSDGRLWDHRRGEEVPPPAGRHFHPDLVRFAPDGRFVPAPGNVRAVAVGRRISLTTLGLVDTATDRTVRFGNSLDRQHRADFGFVVLDRDKVRLLPTTPAHLDLPADLLERWLQVVVRGELGPEGGLVSWDEPTWERKRQELATARSPASGLPFPGFVAADPLHWLRAEFGQVHAESDARRLAADLLRRAEALRNEAEVARWREEVRARTPEVLPRPREDK
jgi:WD40 repeat protein